MTEDHQPAQSSVQKDRKSNIHEMRNQDFVSRLLAATPPYMYSTSIGTNNFFFSDMLRSLVQAKNNENARNLQLQQAALARRPRKRPWGQQRPYYEHVKERKEIPEEKPIEKPLELTNKQVYPIASKYSKEIREQHQKLPAVDCEIKTTTSSSDQSTSQTNTETSNLPVPDPPQATLPPSDLVLPTTPHIGGWYPNIYPPYVDPLHFFIDLRVSGHFYDRKKENSSPLANATDTNNIQSTSESISKSRHASAFSVPIPRSNDCKSTAASATAINLSSNNNLEKFHQYSKFYDFGGGGEAKENQPNIYSKLYDRSSDIDDDNKSDEGNSKEHIDVESNRCTDDEDEVHEID